MKGASQITLFDFDDDQREKMMEDFFELFELKHLESSFKLYNGPQKKDCSKSNVLTT
jgi:hypothetical protein